MMMDTHTHTTEECSSFRDILCIVWPFFRFCRHVSGRRRGKKDCSEEFHQRESKVREGCWDLVQGLDKIKTKIKKNTFRFLGDVPAPRRGVLIYRARI